MSHSDIPPVAQEPERQPAILILVIKDRFCSIKPSLTESGQGLVGDRKRWNVPILNKFLKVGFIWFFVAEEGFGRFEDDVASDRRERGSKQRGDRKRLHGVRVLLRYRQNAFSFGQHDRGSIALWVDLGCIRINPVFVSPLAQESFRRLCGAHRRFEV